MYWKISPADHEDYGEILMPANTEEDHDKALEYMQRMLEMLFNKVPPGQEISFAFEICDKLIDY